MWKNCKNLFQWKQIKYAESAFVEMLVTYLSILSSYLKKNPVHTTSFF